MSPWEKPPMVSPPVVGTLGQRRRFRLEPLRDRRRLPRPAEPPRIVRCPASATLRGRRRASSPISSSNTRQLPFLGVPANDGDGCVLHGLVGIRGVPRDPERAAIGPIATPRDELFRPGRLPRPQRCWQFVGGGGARRDRLVPVSCSTFPNALGTEFSGLDPGALGSPSCPAPQDHDEQQRRD